jgi:mono/diheme cytochrome c family protein
MKFFAIVGIVLTVVIAFGIYYAYSGSYDVAATMPHTEFVRWSLDHIQMSSVRAHAESVSPAPDLATVDLTDGLEHYHAMCVTCHGAPGVQPSAIGKGLNPTPPDLSESAEELSEEELFWIAKNGIKMTGMPAFGPTHQDEDIWEMVGFLKKLPGLSPEAYEDMLQKAGLEEGPGSAPAEEQSAEAFQGRH